MKVSQVIDRGARWVTELGGQLINQQRALDNARRASTRLSRCRVERQEVALYLDDLDAARADSASAAAEETSVAWADAPARAAD